MNRPAASPPEAPVRSSSLYVGGLYVTGLYVTGNEAKFVDKVHERGADSVPVDPEHSVMAAEKPRARQVPPDAMKKVVRGAADVAVRLERPAGMAMPDIEAATRSGLSAIGCARKGFARHQAIDRPKAAPLH